ncbi:MAG TPA: dipeptide ABC transporter ATP-binding protein [Casimicrobiaceae bacterium]|nr:dipeptide ABC transporter ATP-binding protein [Casimicrobiaceae bacterium]
MSVVDSRAPLLEARELARHYRVSRGFMRGSIDVRALDGVSFTLAHGKTLAVVGESGCGKSTLARQVTMIETPTAGSLLLEGADVAHADRAARKRLRPRVQMVFQNPYASLNPRRTVGALLEEPLVIHRRGSPRERREKALAILHKVGLRREHYARYPHMFSGGQRQRIAVARALMLDPPLVVADEPISALDVSIQAQVLNLLLDLQQELAIAYLFIAHNLQVVRHIADTVLVMYLGKAVEQGAKDAIFARPLHPYTQALLASTPSLGRARQVRRDAPAAEPPSPLDRVAGCAFRTRCVRAIARCAVDTPVARTIGGVMVACHRAEE